jgi:nucleoside-diphosphate-sugar epimerase
MKSEKVLIAGGAGFGKYLVQERMDRGLGVFAPDISNTKHDRYIRADVRNFR